MNLTTANTAIVLDSTADYTDEARAFPNWRVVPLYVLFGDESYRDYVDLGPDQFYERLRVSTVTPTTSQPTPGDFLATYEGLAHYERIISLHIGATFSGTYQGAVTAAAGLGDKVKLVDTETVSGAVAMLALAIQRRLEAGTTDEEVDELIARFKEHEGVLFTVDTLEFLQRGGRIGRARAMAGTLMNIKPVLAIRDGEVVPVKRVRGSQKALEELADEVAATTADGPTVRLAYAHAAAPERVATLQELIRKRRPQAQVELTTTLGAVVGTHAGPGAVGVFWFDDAPA
jgi:DegV family protein with EDD domain